jgi:hypothetical protein
MPAYVPDQVMDFYEALFKGLFTTPFSAEILDRRRRNEMRRRVEALGESAAQSTIRMLTNQRVSETDVACILDGLRPLSMVMTCEELAQTHESTQGLVEQILTKESRQNNLSVSLFIVLRLALCTTQQARRLQQSLSF